MNLQVIAGPDGEILWVARRAAGLGARQEGRVDPGHPGETRAQFACSPRPASRTVP
jgi:hypothetical protein